MTTPDLVGSFRGEYHLLRPAPAPRGYAGWLTLCSRLIDDEYIIEKDAAVAAKLRLCRWCGEER